MSEIVEKIISTPEREKGGVTAFNRFSYQNNWALCHLLKIHEEGKDYILAFECHDDVLEIDISSSPSLKFYQIKTKKNGALKIGNALESKYLGKLYCNYTNFPEDTSGLFLVSNNNFVADLKIGSSIGADNIKLSEIKEKDLKKIGHKIKEIANTDDVNFDIISLVVSPLHLDSHQDLTLGATARFLETHDKSKVSVPFHRALSDEIARRAAFEDYSGSKEEFYAKKSISRTQFETYLNRIVLRPDFETVKDAIRTELMDGTLTFSERKNILDSLNTYEIDLLSPSNNSIEQAKKVINKIYSEFNKTDFQLTFHQTINQILDIAEKDDLIKSLMKHKNRNYIKAIIAVEICL